MPTNLFFLILFTLLAFLGQFYSFTYFTARNQEVQLKIELESIKDELEREKLKHRMTSYHFRQFQQEVAKLLPIYSHKKILHKKFIHKKEEALRTLASLSTKPKNEILENERIKNFFLNAKKQFEKKKFKKSIKTLKVFIQKNAFSTHIVEAYSLLIKNLLELKMIEPAVQKTTDMIRLFPNHSQTGFTLLEIGDMYRRNREKEEAKQIYQNILSSFSDKKLLSKTKRSLKRLKL